MKRLDLRTRGPSAGRARSLAADTFQAALGKFGEVRDSVWRELTYEPEVLRPYSKPMTLRRRLAWLAVAPLLFVFCFVYGFFFAITAPYMVVQCALPILTLGLLSIWALPDERVAPTRFMRLLLTGYIISLCLWPRYLAVSLPGLPWITPNRFFGIPLGFLLLISLSISPRFRRQLAAIMSATPLVWKGFAIFTAIQFLTVAVSKSPANSLNRVIMQQVDWTTIFLFSAYMFSRPGRIRRYIAMIASMIVPIFYIAITEYNLQHVLWMAHVPSFLAVEDIERVLSPEFRFGTNEYRTKAVFSTALGLAQFSAIMTPFYIYYIHKSKNNFARASAFLLLLLSYLCIEYSGSRLGLVGMMWSFLLYVFMHAFIRWRRFRHDLLAPAIFYSYPAFFVTVMTASFTINSVHDSVWGGGAQAGSNQARIEQIRMALPSVAKNPIGYGAGGSGEAMGFAEGRFVTIDNYLISLALDYGVIGLVTYLFLFIAASSYAFRAAIQDPPSRDPEAEYLIPLGVAVSAFIVIKLVFSQIDNDPLLYMLAGMLVALTARVNRDRRKQALEAGAATGSDSLRR